MTAPRWPLLVLALAALALARKRPALRPAAVALSALACIDLARGAGLPRRLDVALWLAWPGISAALAWRVWRGRAWPVALAFAAYAAAVALVPVTWGPLTWWAASRAPFWLSPAVALVAWGTRKEEGPGADYIEGTPGPTTSPTLPGRHSGEPRPLAGRSVALPAEAGRRDGRADATAPSPAAQASREVAALLAWSGLVDVLVGALSPSGSHDLAAPIAWATWALVGRALLRAR
jgi:hypothetical protein